MKVCLITGAHGYVGGAICTALTNAGWQPKPMSRSPRAGEVPFQLGDDVSAESLQGVSALIHCAYDFSFRDTLPARRVNVIGTRKLFIAARAAGIRHIMLISSMSAFDGCQSNYGTIKMEMEALAREFGAAIVRPGLVYGAKAGGVFGQLAKVAAKGGLVPLIGNGLQVQYLVHQEDLGRAIAGWCSEEVRWPATPVVLANEEPLTMKGIIQTLAPRKPFFLPIPAGAVLAGLQCAEILGLKLNFRSDSLVGLLHPNLQPDFSTQRALGLSPRPFPEGL